MAKPRPSGRRSGRVMGLGAAGALVLTAVAVAQISIRPDDPSGLSLREQRVRVVHARTPEVPGTSMHLQLTDPWLAYQRGRSYFFHEWSVAEGVFKSASERSLSTTTTSCGMCHNLPFRTAGAGGNTAEPLGFGRNTPHLFGVGLIEMIGHQIRAELLARLDTNRNGWLDVPAETSGRRAEVTAARGVVLDLGSLDDGNGDHRPDLNGLLLPVYLDTTGRALRRTDAGKPVNLADPRVAGLDVVVGILASTPGDHQFASLRAFHNGALRTVMGVLPDDPTLAQAVGPEAQRRLDEVWAGVSNAGARQASMPLLASVEQLLRRTEPGSPGTMGEGEIDLAEWYLLNQPRPALGPQDEQTRRGEALLGTLGCTSCHTPTWDLRAADSAAGYAGDRRFFDLEVAHNPTTRRLEGRLRRLDRRREQDGSVTFEPMRAGFRVERIYSDFRHHDLGPRFTERFHARGKLYPASRFRTPPLWGVGSTAPYGHDGKSSTLDEVIRRHGGEAEASTDAYLAASPSDREALIAYLRSLVLYQPDVLPTDLDGDGVIADPYRLAGREVGPERLQAELLFRVAPSYRGWIAGPDGDRFFSFELLNQAEAYGETLTALVDRDRDGLPDWQQRAAAAAAERKGDARR